MVKKALVVWSTTVGMMGPILGDCSSSPSVFANGTQFARLEVPSIFGSPPHALFSAYVVADQQSLITQPLPHGARTTVCSAGDPIPEGDVFTGFSDATGSAEGSISFVGEGNGSWASEDKFLGIYTVDQPGTAVRKLIDVHDSLRPLGPRCGERFAFLSGPVRISEGLYVFGGSDSYGDGCEGIFLHSQSGGVRSLVDNVHTRLRRISGPAFGDVNGSVALVL